MASLFIICNIADGFVPVSPSGGGVASVSVSPSKGGGASLYVCLALF